MTKEECFEQNFETIMEPHSHPNGCGTLQCSFCYYYNNNPEKLEKEHCDDFKKDFTIFLRRKKLEKLLYQ